MRRLFNCISFLAGLAASAAALHAVLPSPLDALSAEERNTLAKRKECQVLFLGPSYIEIQFDSKYFDDEAQQIGLDLRSCSFGRPYLGGFELLREIELFLRHDWPKLELLVLDITIGQKLAFEEENRFKQRVIEWHTWNSISWLSAYYRRDPRSWREKLPEAFAHLEHVAAHYLLMGRGTAWLTDVESGGASKKVTRPRRVPMEHHPGYAHKLASLKHQRAKAARHPAYAASDWPLELRDAVRSHGYEAMFLYAPIWHYTPLPDRAVSGDDQLEVMDFADPRQFPELYVENVRGLTQHLNPNGREPYSRALAREIKKRWTPRQGARAESRK